MAHIDVLAAHRSEPGGALYLDGSSLKGDAGNEPTTFRAIARTGSEGDVYRAICSESEAGLPDEARSGRIFETSPLPTDTTLAGNPFVYLNVVSDAPGGHVEVNLFSVEPEASCSPVPFNQGTAFRTGGWGVKSLSHGSADLRFHQGNFDARDFPVGAPAVIRVDLTHLAEVIPAGHRVAVVVSRANAAEAVSLPYVPQIAIQPNSHVVLPVIAGSLDGGPPLASYPPRPFLP